MSNEEQGGKNFHIRKRKAAHSSAMAKCYCSIGEDHEWEATPNQAPTKLLEETRWILNRLIVSFGVIPDEHAHKRELAEQALTQLYAQWLESECLKIIGDDDLYIKNYQRDELSDVSYMIAVKHRNHLRTEQRAALSAEIDKLRGKK